MMMMMSTHSRIGVMWTLLLLMGTVLLSPKEKQVLAFGFLPSTTTRGATSGNTGTPSRSRSTSTILMMGSSLDDELENLEEARSKFEFLMQTEGLMKDNMMVPLPHHPNEYTPRPLTEQSKQRREHEMS